MATVLDYAKRDVKPLAIEPYDREWGIGVSGLSDEKSPFPRINRLHEWVRTKNHSIDPKRGRIVTEAYQKYDGETTSLKWAHIFSDILHECDVFMYDDELIAGDIAAPACECGVYPEYGMEAMMDEFKNWPMDERPNDILIVPQENQDAIAEYADFWTGKTLLDNVQAKFNEYNRLGSGGPFSDITVYNCNHYATQGVGHGCADMEKILGKGWEGIRKEVQEAEAKLTEADPRYAEKKEFYEASYIVIDAVEHWIHRYGDLCDELAAKEENAERKAELERIAANCHHVATDVPRDFWEAIQLLHFTYCLTCIEANGHSVGYGRFDVIMRPFYNTEVLSREFCQELIENLFIKMRELNKFRDRFGIIFASGTYYGGISLDVGGTDEQGNDITNDLSYMVMDAYAHTRMPVPWLGVRFDKDTPREFKIKVFNVVRMGCGEPKIFNDEVMVPGLVEDGVPIELARTYMPVGCVEPTIPGYMHGWHDSGYICGPKIMQMALTDGIDWATGKRIGAPTGYLKDMKDIEEVKNAVEEQWRYWINNFVDTSNKIDEANMETKHLPFLSLLYNDCIEEGKDIVCGGARFNRNGPQFVGMGTCADIMATIEQVVFEQKLISGEELVKACMNNWTGYKEVYAYVNSDKVHHYGNDDDYADKWATWICHLYSDLLKEHHTRRDPKGFFIPGLYSIAINVALGGECKATPDGRVDWEPTSDCLGAVHTYGGSHDVSGPTAIAKSVAKINQAEATNGVILNWKFSPNTVSGEAGRDDLIQLIDTYFALGGKQSQFNVITKETMLEAQKKPADYRDLLVRVAGYSTYFTEMSPVLQDDLINRTELSLD